MSEIERDLSFEPVVNPEPKHITAQQVEFYNREGYLFPFDVFTPGQAEANRAYFDGLLEQVGSDNSYALNCFQARCEGIYDLCTNPRILDLVEEIIGPNIICWASHYFCKMPYDKKGVPWHQDASYWGLSPSRTVTAWLAIDDADEENSAMRFIPRTHDKGHLKWKRATGDVVLDQEIIGIEEMGEAVSDNLKAGQVSLHVDMLAHGSEPNKSGRRRCGLTIRYCPPKVKAVDPRWANSIEAIICRGEDPYGHWQHNARPTGNEVKPKEKPRSVGGN